jgi:O-antigen/teichoic acid export membrane protein
LRNFAAWFREEENRALLVYEKLLSGLRSYASVRLLSQVISWLGTIYVVRRVGSHALGQYAVALVVFNYLSLTYDGTLLEALVQKLPQTGAERRAVFTLMVGIGCLLAALTAAAAGAVGQLVGDREVASLIGGVALALALLSFGVLPQATLARQMAFSRLATIGAIQAVCVTVTSVALAWDGAGAWALIAAQIVGAAVRVMLLNLASHGLLRPTWQVTPAFAYLRVGGVLFADNLLWRWYTSLDTFLLGRWAGTSSLGFYNLAQQVAELPLEKISTVVNDISLPAYAELRTHPQAAAELLLETIRMHATAGFALFWGLAVVAPYAVPVLFGSSWHNAILPLMALAAVAPLRLIGSIETPAMTGIGRPAVLLKTKLIIAPCMTAALLLACRLGGINGAAFAWLAMFPLCYGFAFRYVLQAAGIPYRRVFAIVRGPIAAAALMVAIVLAWQHLIAAMNGSPLLDLLSAIIVGGCAYIGGLRVLDPASFQLVQARVERFVGLRQAA